MPVKRRSHFDEIHRSHPADCRLAVSDVRVPRGEGRSSVLHAKIKAGALVVDVRTPVEFASGAYPGAINIPVD